MRLDKLLDKSGGTRAGAQALVASTQFTQLFKNLFLRINLNQIIPKNVYFFEKSSIIATASGPPNAVNLRRLGAPTPDPRVLSPAY